MIKRVLDDVKATEIRCIRVSAITAMFDYVIIATVESGRQSRAACEKIRDVIKPLKIKILGIEGLDSGEWVLLDTGSIVLHLMRPEARSFYNLDELWLIDK